MSVEEVTTNIPDWCEKLKKELSGKIIAQNLSAFNPEFRINASDLIEVVELLKDQSDYSFNMLLNVTVVDFMDQDFFPRLTSDRFDVVYHFLSIKHSRRLVLKVSASESKPAVPTLTGSYLSANFMEREAWDMFGVEFTGHPDLRRILMYEEFIGHPLRKDYPIQGKQPRVPLRYPEVENTARFMHRPELIQISKKAS